MDLTVRVHFSLHFLQGFPKVIAGHCLGAGGDAMATSLCGGGTRLEVAVPKPSFLCKVLHIVPLYALAFIICLTSLD